MATASLLVSLLAPWEDWLGFNWTPPGEKPLVLSFTGDIMAHDVNFKMKDYSKIYESLAEILHADDFSFANLEAPVDPGKPYSTYPSFNIHLDYVEAAVKAGFDGFSLANNHVNDQGVDSLKATWKSLSSVPGLVFHGLRAKAGEPRPAAVVEIKGYKIGFLSFTSLLNQGLGKDFIEYYPYANFYNGVIREDLVKVMEARIRQEKSRCDILILGFHDGLEYVKAPLPAQVKVYRRLVEAGVDILWGHHPHVVLPMEVWPAGNRQGIIFYSMGNFISGQAWRLTSQDWNKDRARTGDGILVQVQVQRTPLGVFPVLGKVYHLNNYHHPLYGMVTGLTKTWIETLEDPQWRNYYEERLKIQEGVVSTPVSTPEELHKMK